LCFRTVQNVVLDQINVISTHCLRNLFRVCCISSSNRVDALPSGIDTMRLIYEGGPFRLISSNG